MALTERERTMKLPAVPLKRDGVSKRNSPKPTLLRSEELRRVRLAIHPCSKLQGILAKANKTCRYVVYATLGVMQELRDLF